MFFLRVLREFLKKSVATTVLNLSFISNPRDNPPAPFRPPAKVGGQRQETRRSCHATCD